MRNPRIILLFIAVLTLLAVLIDLPKDIPLKFNLGSLGVDRVITPPKINLPFLGIEQEIYTHLGLDLQGGIQLVLEADMTDIAASDRLKALDSTREIVERRVNFFGVSEPMIQSAQVGESYRVIVELPGLKDTSQAVDLIGQTARLEFRELTADATSSAVFPTLNNTLATGLTGKDLKKAEVSFDQQTGEPVVAFELMQEGGEKFAELTTRLVGQRLAIFLDDLPLSAPTVKSPITEGKGIITGSFTRDSAKALALQLSAGALPAPINIIEQRTIGATLGAESVRKSIQAGLIGLSLVALFMVLYYGFVGFLADLALIVYGLVTFAIFRLLPVTLTLPGIAGFILSIGMAVDANILIFEQMKDEVRSGRSWQMAMELGFGRAWDAIRDANFTTLLTAFILFNPASWSFLPIAGMVRGFALTLAIGVIVGLFTGIIVTRNLLRVFYPGWMKIKGKFRQNKLLSIIPIHK